MEKLAIFALTWLIITGPVTIYIAVAIYPS